MLAGVAQRTVVLGHTHVQFDLRVAGTRLVNPGSVRGMPYADSAAAYWALLGPDVELRRTVYDVEATTARIRATGVPDPDEFADGLARPPGAAEANEFFERMATAPKSV